MAEGIKERILAAIESKELTKKDAKSLAKALKAAMKDLGKDGGDDDEEEEDEGLLPVLQKMQEAMLGLEKRITAAEKFAKDSGKPETPSFMDIIFGKKN